MLTQVYTTNHPRSTGQPFHLTPFEARELNCLAERNNLGFQWTGDPERFQLVITRSILSTPADEDIKAGQPVNRDEALYWVEQIRAWAGLAEGEDVGWVAVAIASEAEERLLEIVDERLERLLEVESQ